MDASSQEQYNRGVHAFKKRNFTGALGIFNEIRKKFPEDIDALYFTAMCFLRLEEWDKASPLLKKLSAQTKNSFYVLQGHMLLGYVHAAREKYEAAETELAALLKKNYENPQVYAILGYVAYRKKDYGQAEYYYQKSLVLDPNNANSHNGLGSTYVEWKGKIDLALPHFEKALQEKQGYFAYLDSMGWYYFMKKHVQKSLFYLQKAFRLNRHPVIENHLKEAKQTAAGSHIVGGR
jgi:tetratricopeptide (TPR) repeat protein